MIKVSNLSVRYGQHVACSDVSLQVKPGEIVVILGANGAGKSTLLKAMAGISEGQVEGSITLSGRNILGVDANDIVDRGVALVPENRGIFANLSVIENLRLGAYTDRARKRETANLALVHALFPKLVERANQMVRTMSGGERQMVAIGRAIMSAPSILLLDEPSLGLSPLLSKELFGRLKMIKQAGLGILLVEQNAKGSLAIADRGYVLENGRITLEDLAEALQQNPAVQQAYLGASKSHKAVKTSAGATAAKAADLPRPVDTSPKPTDIAAAAMERFSRDAPAASPSQIAPQARETQTAAAAMASSNEPSPRVSPPAVAVNAPAASVAPAASPVPTPPASPIPPLRSSDTVAASTQQATRTEPRSISDLVKRAEARLQQERRPSRQPGFQSSGQSASRHGARSGIGRPVAEPTRLPTAPSPSYVVPEFHLEASSRGNHAAAQGTTPSTDRLRLILEEIEQAATRARGLSSSQQKDV